MNVSYGYNANGNQVYTQPVNADGSSATTTYVGKYYQVGTNSNTNTWTTTTDNVWAGNTLLATVQKGTNVATSTSYVYPDQLNSVNVVADSSGNLLQTLDYYPYGSTRIDSGSSPVTRTYLSQQRDATNDLTNLNARYYNQRTGQFLSQDPVFLGDPNQQNLSDPQSLNPYAYAGDNPITASDPTGQYTQQQNAAIAGVAAAFGVSSFSGAQSAAIGGLAASFGVSGSQITDITGVSVSSLSSAAQNSSALSTSQVNGADAGVSGIHASSELNTANSKLCLGSSVTCMLISGVSNPNNAERSSAEGLSSGADEIAGGYTQAQYAQFTRQISQYGLKSLLRSKRTLSNLLEQRIQKIEAANAEGGYTSSMETEVANFRGQLNAIEAVIKDVEGLSGDLPQPPLIPPL